MQFMKGGPDIPERLLQRHEDDEVVFFCGAGISKPAELPDFKELTEALYNNLVPDRSAVQRSAIRSKLYDRAIELLETDIVDGRYETRQIIAEVLTPDPDTLEDTAKSLATHKSLLTLSKSHKTERTRLITTNFDRLFEAAIDINKLSPDPYIAPNRYQAPLLPIPDRQWDGLVYLHGLLTSEPARDDFEKLIVSSSDFGRAYLTERWASRFVSEVFRRYTVCFVGYSIDDPVLRYMMDALAAERRLGENRPEAFAFGNYSKRKQEEQSEDWKAKGVTPILYRNHNKHAYLHGTLQEWANAYRDGIRGKEYIVTKSVLAHPLANTEQDHSTDRLLWALSDPSGLPAKHFAEINPAPSLDWLLGPLSKNRYGHDDLIRFNISPNIPPNPTFDKDLAFNIVHRPTPYHLAPPMAFVDSGIGFHSWDEVMKQLSYWLARHLNDPRLLFWLVRQGKKPHQRLSVLISERLDKFAELERNGNTNELDQIRADAHNAIPNKLMRVFWRLFLDGRLK